MARRASPRHRFHYREHPLELIQTTGQLQQSRAVAVEFDAAGHDRFGECGLALDDFVEGRAIERQRCVRRIRLTQSLPALQALAREVVSAYPDDEATPRITAMIRVKTARIAKSN